MSLFLTPATCGAIAITSALAGAAVSYKKDCSALLKTMSRVATLFSALFTAETLYAWVSTSTAAAFHASMISFATLNLAAVALGTIYFAYKTTHATSA